MTKAFSIAILIIILIYGNSCGPKYVQCPAYNNPNFNAWFPYHLGQAVAFTTATGGADTILIDSVSQSPAINLEGETSQCSSAGIIQSQHFSSIRTFISILDVRRTGNGVYYTDVQINQGGIGSGGIVDTGLNLIVPGDPAAQFWHSNFYTKFVFQGKTYDSVQKIYSSDALTLDHTEIDTIYLAKHYGIIGFDAYYTHTLWFIQ